jgi:hypothetical protein
MKLKPLIKEPKLWGLTKTDMRNAGRVAIEAAGKLWHAVFKRRHFQLEAFDLYRYRRRSKKHEAIKARIHPEAGGRPLVFTGGSEQLAMSQDNVTAKARSFDRYHAEVKVSAPNLSFHSKEMTTTTAGERAEMAETFGRVFAEELVRAAQENGVSRRQINLLSGHLSAA